MFVFVCLFEPQVNGLHELEKHQCTLRQLGQCRTVVCV